jgi:hypothetical protein
MVITYEYMISGFGANDQTWETSGTISVDKQGEFTEAVQKAMMASFQKLTNGKARYGKPGVGCNGPYRVTKMILEVMS